VRSLFPHPKITALYAEINGNLSTLNSVLINVTL